MPNVTSFDRIAEVAARRFVADGYSAISLRAIAGELSIKPASLYYHCPRGKTELFARSLCAYFADYRVELAEAAGSASFPRSVLRMADWMLEHPPVDAHRIVRTDLPQLEAEDADLVMASLHESVLGPFVDAFQRAPSSVKRNLDPTIAAAAVVALVDGLGFQHLPVGREPSAAELEAARDVMHTALRMLSVLR